jgi:hypothetical protein
LRLDNESVKTKWFHWLHSRGLERIVTREPAIAMADAAQRFGTWQTARLVESRRRGNRQPFSGGRRASETVVRCLTRDEIAWMRRAADLLALLDGSKRTWRSIAAHQLRNWLSSIESNRNYDVRFSREDANDLLLIGLEIAFCEDPTALASGRATWRTLAGDDLAELATQLHHQLDRR